MFNKNYTSDFLNLQGVKATSIQKLNNCIFVYLESTQDRPNNSCIIHDYRIQKINYGIFNNQNIFLILKKRRFKDKYSNRIITEKFSFVSFRRRTCNLMYPLIIDSFKNKISMSQIAKNFNVSINTVIRAIDIVNIPHINTLPNIVGIDEFKGNSGGEKYNVILTDPQSHKILDIFVSREQVKLYESLKNIRNKENVKYVTQDMWEPFKNVFKKLFPKVKVVADKYHFVRQIYWALNNIRKRVQKELGKDLRIYFKHSKYLLTKKAKDLKLEEKQRLNRMFYYSEELRVAYDVKEMFNDFLEEPDFEKSKQRLNNWIEMAKECNFKEFEDCIKAFTNWFIPICNSKLIKATNGYTEGCNNKIKVLKRISFGMTNYERFRKRILLLA